MKKRIITGLLILIAVAPPLILGGMWLQALIYLIIAVGSYEIVKVTQLQDVWKYSVLIALVLGSAYLLPTELYSAFFAGVILVLFFLAMVDEKLTVSIISYFLAMILIVSLALKGIDAIYQIGNVLMLFVFVACFGSDVGAYFVGVTIGKNKLLERVSPKKTWEGSIGGWLTGGILALIVGWQFLNFKMPLLVILSLSLPLVGQLGDLAFSLIKRTYGVKDFGNVFPGHGGFLDRIDSLLFCLMFVYMVSCLI
ncbi:MAG: phosphatidate cytidylyltransferase [Anaerorhabdus sp.]